MKSVVAWRGIAGGVTRTAFRNKSGNTGAFKRQQNECAIFLLDSTQAFVWVTL